MGKPLIIANNDSVVLLRDNGRMESFRLPSLRDGKLHEFSEILDRLPDGIGLIIDRNIDRMRVFKIQDAACLDVSEGSGIETLIIQRSAKQPGRELPHAEHGHAEREEARQC